MSQPTTSTEAARIVAPEDAATYLKEFGLTVEMLHRSIEVGDNKRGQVNQDVYPLTYRGFVMWAETLAELRRQLLKISDGYEIGRTRNYETIYCVKRNVAIAVVAGDSMVGIRGIREPRLTRKKGTKTTERVRRNAQHIFTQGELFHLPAKKKIPDDEACLTWFLMVRPTSKEVRLEFSWPLSIDGDGYVGVWQRRILLPPVAISGAIAPVNPDDDELIDDGNDSIVSR
jgi:hypothetical protein